MSVAISRALAAVGRYGKIGRTERSIFLTALFSSAVIRAALPFVPVLTMIRVSKKLGQRWPIRDAASIELDRAARRIAQARRYLPLSTCLSEAIAAHFTLTRLGRDCEVRIGVAKANGRFTAHAWLECGSAIVGNSAPEGKEYAAMPSLRRFTA